MRCYSPFAVNMKSFASYRKFRLRLLNKWVSLKRGYRYAFRALTSDFFDGPRCALLNKNSINQSKNVFHIIDNQVQHIHGSNVKRGTLTCNTYKTLSPFTNYS